MGRSPSIHHQRSPPTEIASMKPNVRTVAAIIVTLWIVIPEPFDARLSAAQEKDPQLHPAAQPNAQPFTLPAQRRQADAERLLEKDAQLQQASQLNAQGLTLLAQRQYTDAELLFKGAIAIREKVLGSEDPYLAQSLDSLAVVYQAE